MLADSAIYAISCAVHSSSKMTALPYKAQNLVHPKVEDPGMRHGESSESLDICHSQE